MSFKVSLVFALALLSMGCLGGLHKQYQPEGPVYCRDNLRQFFIEFTDQGFFWDPAQLNAVVRSIHDERTAGRRPLVLMFVHGWQHSAKDKGKYVKLFRKSLLESLLDSGLAGKRPVIAVYVGWSGRSTWLPILRQFNFFARYATASRIGQGSDFPYALQQISIAAKAPLGENPRGWVIVGGHSMGSMILQEALVHLLPTPSEPGDDLEREVSTTDLLKLPDQFIFLNSAAHSSQTMKVLTQLARKPVREHVGAGECKFPAPLFISLSSEADFTTKRTFRFSRRLELYPGSRRTKEKTFSFPFSYSEKYFWSHTEGNNSELRTHRILSDSACPSNVGAIVSNGHLKHLPLAKASGPQTPELQDYCLVEVSQPFNDSFWFISIPKDLSKKHDAIFSNGMVALLAVLVRLRFDGVADEAHCTSANTKPHSQATAPTTLRVPASDKVVRPQNALYPRN